MCTSRLYRNLQKKLNDHEYKKYTIAATFSELQMQFPRNVEKVECPLSRQHKANSVFSRHILLCEFLIMLKIEVKILLFLEKCIISS